MKRIIICGLFLLLGVATLQAKAPWGALPQVDADQPHTAVDDPLTILKKLTSGQPVKVYFTFDDTDDWETLGFEPPDESDHEHSKIEYTKMLQIVADDWFQIATEAIKQSKRSAQFPEVLKHLRHSAKMQIVSKEDEADLRVYVASLLKTVQEKCGSEKALACVISGFNGKTPELIVSYGDKEFEFNLLHEWGHVLGLDDQYDGGVYSHPQYHSTNRYPSLMANPVYWFSYDDVDGLINLIDIIYGTEPARAKGWRSFVEGSPDVYLNGQVKGAGKYGFDFFGEEAVAHLYTYANGKIIKEQEFAFVTADPFVQIPDKQVLEKDHLGRPVRAKGPAGEDIYYLYDYNISHRLIIKDGKAIRTENLEKKYNEKGKEVEWVVDGVFLFANKETMLALNVVKGEGGMVGFVEEGVSQLGYQVDKQGRISTTSEQIGDLHLTPEQMEKIGVQLRAWGKEQLQRIGFVPKPQVAKPATAQAAAKPKATSTQASKPKAGQQTAKPNAAQNSAQSVREQLSKQLKK